MFSAAKLIKKSLSDAIMGDFFEKCIFIIVSEVVCIAEVVVVTARAKCS